MKTFKTFPETDCPRANALVVEPFCLGDFFIMETEIWKDIPDYEGLYQVSNLGRVKSLAKSWVTGKPSIIHTKPETILKHGKDGPGYYFVNLYKCGKGKMFKIHRLVFETFKYKTNLQIDHINEIKTDNRFCNLQQLTPRQNTTKHFLTKKTSSNFTGVYWNKHDKKWKSRIRISGKQQHLGSFTTELEAAKAYQDKLNTIK